jgi:hypothetical protein
LGESTEKALALSKEEILTPLPKTKIISNKILKILA